MLQPSKYDQILNGTYQVGKVKKMMFEIIFIPGLDQKLENLNFTWNITAFNSKELKIKLNFEHPELVSAMTTPDELKIYFRAGYLF